MATTIRPEVAPAKPEQPDKGASAIADPGPLGLVHQRCRGDQCQPGPHPPPGLPLEEVRARRCPSGTFPRVGTIELVRVA